MHDDESLIGNQEQKILPMRVCKSLQGLVGISRRDFNSILCLIGFLVFRFGNNGDKMQRGSFRAAEYNILQRCYAILTIIYALDSV
jgi:hypothetical protein